MHKYRCFYLETNAALVNQHPFWKFKNDVIFAWQSYAAYANNAIFFFQKLMSDCKYLAINMVHVW